MMKAILYLIPTAYILFRTYREQKLYKLLFLLILLISYFGSTEDFQKIPFSLQVLTFLIFLICAISLFIFYRRDLRKAKFEALKEKRRLDRQGEEIQKQDPTRRKKILIIDQKNKKEEVYWASPSLEDRLRNESEED